jgi:FkbM family methyltransferase
LTLLSLFRKSPATDTPKKLDLRSDKPAGGAKPKAKPQAVENGVVELSDGEQKYNFAYVSGKEMRRAQRIFEKEPGTIEWIRQELRPDDIFYDVGANIGVYTIYAGRRLGPGGHVYAFEPHTPNAGSVIENAFLNDLQDRVTLITAPLTDSEHYDVFNYQSVMRASSTSQFGRAEYEGETFASVFREIKFGTSIDSLIARELIPAPSLVKIDVDGLDYEVLAGMRRLMESAARPRSLQIELGSDSKSKIMRQCEETGYILKEKHWSMAGKDFIAAGNDPEDYPHYGIFYHPNAEA